MALDEKKALKDIEQSISTLEDSLTSEIIGKEISSISKIPFKVVALTYSLHHRSVDLARNSLKLYKKEDYVASAILIRSLMETTALIFLIKKKITQVIASKKIGEIDNFIMNSTYGGRTKDSPLECPNILTAIDHTNKEYDSYRTMYDDLSEFTHPNWIGTSGLYSKDELSGAVYNGKVLFGKNINPSKPKYILASFLTGLAVLQITFSDLKKSFDEFINIAEDDIINKYNI